MRYDASDHRPAVMVVAPDPLASAEACATVEAADGRAEAADPAAATAALAGPMPPAALFVELPAGPDTAFDTLLLAIDRAARAGRAAAVVRVPTDALDAAMALAPDPAIALLVGEDPLETAAALGLLLVGRPVAGRLREEAAGARDLVRLAEEAARVARALAAMAALPGGGGAGGGLGDGRAGSGGAGTVEDAAVRFMAQAAPRPGAAPIRRLLRERRLRDRFFAPALFADPAWDMLLDLAAARLEGLEVAVSSLCIAAAVPPTTALRWIKQMTAEGLFLRIADPDDRRRIFIALSDEAATAMTAYLRALDGVRR